MGGSVNLQGGGQYQMPGAGYSGMQGSVNAPQTADQYAASMAARQPAQTGARGPISFNPFTGEPDYSYDPGYAAEPANPWTGTPAPVQNPYYAYGNQTAPWMTASEATGYAPMNIPNMSFARPQFYYPSISNQMAFMQGMGGYGGGLGGMGYGGYMGMPGYFSGLGAMGSYMPMMQRSYPTYQNQYPALGGNAGYQPRMPARPTAYGSGTSTGGKGMQTPQQQPTTPTTPTYNPALSPVAPPTNQNLNPVAPPPVTPAYRPPEPQLTYERPTPPTVQPTYPTVDQPLEPELTYERPTPPTVEPTYPVVNPEPEQPFDPLAGGGLLGGYTMPDMRLPGGGVNPDLFVPGGPIATNPQPTVAENLEGQGGVSRGFDTSTMDVAEP